MAVNEQGNVIIVRSRLHKTSEGSAYKLHCAQEKISDRYDIVEFSTSREDYGRLDYNATIAHRIHTNLYKTEDLGEPDIHVPDIILSRQVIYRAVVPRREALDKLVDGERVVDITKEWIETSNERRRWIILFPRKDTPIEIPREDETLYLAGEPVENLNKNLEVRKFLTFSFENEIFAYAERALKHVQAKLGAEMTDHKLEMLRIANLEIHSLFARKLPRHDTSAFCMPDDQWIDNSELQPSKCRDIAKEFQHKRIDNSELQSSKCRDIAKEFQHKSLHKCGIQGFGNTIDGFLVFVAEPKQYAERKGIEDRIEKCVSKYLKDKPKIVWFDKLTMSDLTAQGGQLTNTQANKCGTLGCFGKEANNLVAITAGHFIEKDQTVQIENDGVVMEFGQCIASHYLADFDIAIIKINADMLDRCSIGLRNEKGEDCPASVYEEDHIKNWPVHKIGATTQSTRGVVYCGNANVCQEKGILINGIDSVVFAEPGDSGSIVFFYDPEDIDNRAVKLLSIVSKRIDLEAGARPVDLDRKLTLTRNLKDGLQKVSNITI